MKTFLDVCWNNLLLVNYQVDPVVLEKYRPVGTELDTYQGKHYVSVVAFEFAETRIFGVPMPLYRSFPEINLRFYVRRKVDGKWRRGVVFIKEIVPCRLPALIANKVFRENFHVHPLTSNLTEGLMTYRWDHQGEIQEVRALVGDECELPESGSLSEHIIEHYWAYKDLGDGKAGEFQVSHCPWEIQHCPDTSINLDLARIYGSEIAEAMNGVPASVFYSKGSRVGVTKPLKF